MIAATTLILEMVPNHRRGEASSYLFVGIQVGLGAGPALGQALSHWGPAPVWWAATLICASGVLTCLVVLQGRDPLRTRPAVLVKPTYGPALTSGVLAGLGTMGFAGFLAHSPLYTREIGLDRSWVVFLLASGTLAAVRIVAADAPDRRGSAEVGGFSFVALAAGFAVIAAVPSAPGLLVGTVIMSAEMSLLVASLILHATRGVAEGEEARRLSAFTFFLDLGGAVGPTLMAVAVVATGLGHGFALFMLASVARLLLLRLWVPAPRPTPSPEGFPRKVTMSPTPPSPDASDLRVGLVGLSASGGWAAMAHLPAIAAVDGITLTALATSSESSARAAAATYDVPHAFGSVAELAGSDVVDLVVVAVKVPLHRDVLLSVLPAGKPVLCEWPLARNLTEADELLAAAAAVRTFVGLQARSSPTLRHLRDLVADGYVGRVLSTSLVASGRPWGLPVTERTAYILDPQHGATMLTIPFGHTIDAVSMVLGELSEVRATTASRRDSLPSTDGDDPVPLLSEDQVAVTGRIGDGAVLSAHYRGGVSRGTNFLWEINGTEGDLRVLAPSGSLQLGDVTVLGARGDERELAEIAVPASYDAFPDLAGTPAHNVAHAYAQVADDLRHGTHEAPDFAHARDRHLLLENVRGDR